MDDRERKGQTTFIPINVTTMSPAVEELSQETMPGLTNENNEHENQAYRSQPIADRIPREHNQSPPPTYYHYPQPTGFNPQSQTYGYPQGQPPMYPQVYPQTYPGMYPQYYPQTCCHHQGKFLCQAAPRFGPVYGTDTYVDSNRYQEEQRHFQDEDRGIKEKRQKYNKLNHRLVVISTLILHCVCCLCFTALVFYSTEVQSVIKQEIAVGAAVALGIVVITSLYLFCTMKPFSWPIFLMVIVLDAMICAGTLLVI